MAVTSAIAAVVGAGVGIAGAVQSAESAKDQKKANAAAQKNAEEQLETAKDELNRANARSPNTSYFESKNKQAAKAGPSGTLLTGAKGVDPNSLSLGKATLLGGG